MSERRKEIYFTFSLRRKTLSGWQLLAAAGTMSVFRSSECVFCLFSKALRPASVARRPFHSSPIHQKRKPRFPSVKTDNNSNNIDLAQAAKDFPSAKNGPIPQNYSPEQRAAIEAAHNLIDGEQLDKQTGTRIDPWTMQYFDDLTKINPVVDKPVRAPWTNTDDNARLKTEDELEDDLVKFMQEIPAPQKHDNDFDPSLWDKFDKNLRLTVGTEVAERSPRTALAPDLPRLSQAPPTKKSMKGDDVVEEEPPSAALVRLMQATGYNRRQISQLRVKTIFTKQVANQTRLGKIRKTYILSVAGNQNGLIGIGEGKAAQIGDARLQSQYRAIRNMTPILRYEDRTIFGDVDGKVSATELELYARPPGKLSCPFV